VKNSTRTLHNTRQYSNDQRYCLQFKLELHWNTADPRC